MAPTNSAACLLSTDGGQNWQKALYVDENTGASDIAMDPSNPDVLYASLWEARQGPWEFGNTYSGTHGGIFKSTDGGKTWRKLTQGLPQVAQAYVAIAPSDPRRLYATVAAGREVGIYRSDDAGENWHRATTDPRPANRIGGGDLPVPRVDPKNADTLYSASIVTWRSTDGGQTWTGPQGRARRRRLSEHLDQSQQPGHYPAGGRPGRAGQREPRTHLEFLVQPADRAALSCGGRQCVSVPGLRRAAGERLGVRLQPRQRWRHHLSGMASGGRHRIRLRGARPARSRYRVRRGPRPGVEIPPRTGQVEIISPGPPGGERYRADRTQPIMFSPVDPHVLFYAANVVFKTTDGGHSWQTISPDLTRPHPGIPASLGSMAAKDPGADKQRGVVYALAPSFHNIDTIWAGTDEGLIWITADGGKNWKDITPPALTPWSKVTQLEASHFDDKSAYASVSRFRVDDLTPYIYRTHDGGKTWQLITAGLPNDAPIDTVREDPCAKGCCSRAAKPACGCRSTMAAIGNRCN
jgi:photosystem II stability/assembly factor-like uncharacterized protein